MSEDQETQRTQQSKQPQESPKGGGAHLAPKDKKSHKGLLIVGIIVILALIGVILYLLLGRGTTDIVDEDTPQQRAYVVNEDNAEQIASDFINQEPVRPGNYRAKMNSTWHFASGTEASYDAYVENVEANTNDVYFDLVLADDEDTVLYASPVIPRGGYLDSIALNEDLDPGTYDAVIIYHLVDDDQNTISTLRMTVTVIVEG